jgi:hypothetical protein
VARSKSNLSCIIVRSTNSVSALQFDSIAGTLTNYTSFATSTLPSFNNGAVIG